MSDIVLRSTTRAGVEWRGLVATLQRRLREQDGQDTIEYIGVLLVVAALIGAIAAIIPKVGPTVEHGAEGLIKDVFASNGSSTSGTTTTP